MGDVVTKCVTCIDEDLQSSLLAHLYQIVKVFVNGDFQVVAHGTTANLAVLVQQKFGMQCKSIVLCSPLVKLTQNVYKYCPPEDSQSQFEVSTGKRSVSLMSFYVNEESNTVENEKLDDSSDSEIAET